MIYELSISIQQIYIMNHVSVEALTTGCMIKRRLIVQQQRYRHCDRNTNVYIKAYSFHHILILTVFTTSTANLDCPVEENNMTFNVTGNVTSHKHITDLYPWTTYMFCIAAQTTSGKGADICQEQQTLQDCKY
jgi:hypothetical protein